MREEERCLGGVLRASLVLRASRGRGRGRGSGSGVVMPRPSFSRLGISSVARASRSDGAERRRGTSGGNPRSLSLRLARIQCLVSARQQEGIGPDQYGCYELHPLVSIPLSSAHAVCMREWGLLSGGN